MKKILIIFIITIVYYTFLIEDCSCQWIQTNGPYGESISSFISIGNTVFAGLYSAGSQGSREGIFFSNNNGLNWISVGLPYEYVIAFTSLRTNIYAGCPDLGVFSSTNNGINWKLSKNGIPVFTSLTCLATIDSILLAGTFLSSVWKRSLIDIIGINNTSLIIPYKYKLYQNYPNPFNSRTKTNKPAIIPLISIEAMFHPEFISTESKSEI